ncbi:MAG: alkaline phosphatase family protein [Candidatus Zipacnadales bacterium]
MPSPLPRALILALDGATFDLLNPWIEEGRLPNLAQLIRTSAHGRLRSTIPPITPCAWTSFSTAQNPGRHGIFDFQQFVAGTYHLAPTNGAMRRACTLWEYLNECGLTVGLYNLPWMYPPPKLRGYCVCGFDAPDITPKAVYPPQLSHELHAAVPHLSLAVEFLKMREGRYDLEALRRQVRVNIEAVKFLLTHHPVDVCVLTIMLLDQVAHFFYHADPQRRAWGDIPDVMLAVHEWVDQGLGELLALLPDDCLIMGVSDHGVVPTRITVNIPRVLAEAGLLAFRTSAAPTPTDSPAPRLMRGLARRSPLKAFLSRLLPHSLWLRLRRTRHALRSRERFAAVDWSRTRAFSWGNFAQVRINLRGREPQGIVSAADKPSVVAEIKHTLLELRHPDTGEPLFSEALTPEELYSGPYTEGAADVLGIPSAEGIEAGIHLYQPHAPLIIDPQSAAAAIPEMAEKVAGHSSYGIFFVTGEPFRGGATLEGARLYDALPTLLLALGLPIPADLDGVPLTAAFDPSFLATHPPRYSAPLPSSPPRTDSPYSPTDRAAVEQRLGDLGYL